MVVEGGNKVGWECGESVADRAELAAGGRCGEAWATCGSIGLALAYALAWGSSVSMLHH